MLRFTILLLASLLVLLLSACLDSPSREAPVHTQWRYDPAAPQYGMLPVALQETVSDKPHDLAHRICAELAGELEFISSRETHRAAFTCRFEEDGEAFSLDFGALVLAGTAGGM